MDFYWTITLQDNIEKELQFIVYSTVQILNKAPYISTSDRSEKAPQKAPL